LALFENGKLLARSHVPHELVEGVPRTVGVTLGRPEISALSLLPMSLILVYPPVAHGHSEHRLPQAVTLIKNQSFPRCSKCSEPVYFELERSGPAVGSSSHGFNVMLYELPEIAGQEDESLADDRRSIPLNFFCLFLRRSYKRFGL
jgi:hypothetical protein